MLEGVEFRGGGGAERNRAPYEGYQGQSTEPSLGEGPFFGLVVDSGLTLLNGVAIIDGFGFDEFRY